jgi:outer membrane protein assembly factor BamC
MHKNNSRIVSNSCFQAGDNYFFRSSMNVLNITVSALAVVVLAGCSSTSSKDSIESKSFDYKAPPVKVRELEVPPDLTSYSGDDRYGIPGEGESGTRFSEFSKGGVNRKASNVLPPVKNVRLERKDTRRWLVVDDKAENVWPIVKAFWQENGLVIKIENPQVGMMETDWAENRAKIPMDGMRKFFGGVLGGLYSSGEKDQFHTRLERSKDGNSTEIYISHYGMQEVAEKNETGYRWLTRPSDPELEATMLQLLMSKLGGGSGVLDNTKKPAAVAAKDSDIAPKLNKLADGSQSILLSESFDKSWRKVGLALEQTGIAIADKDRSKGIYFLSVGKDDAKNKLAEKVARTQVNVREISSGCEVTVNNVDGGDVKKIVESLYKALGRL